MRILSEQALQVERNLAAARERIAVLEEERARLLAEISDLKGERHLLITTVVDMKREGYDPLVAVSLPNPPEQERLPSEVQQAVDAVADPGTPLHRQLVDDAWRMLKREEMPPEKVATITRFGLAATREKAWVES